MFLVATLAFFTALAVGHDLPDQPVATPWQDCLLILGGTLALAGMSIAMAVVAAGGVADERSVSGRYLDWFRIGQRCHCCAWCAFAAIVVWGLQWPAIVKQNWQMDSFILLDDLLAIAPIFLPWLIAWTAFYEVEKAALIANRSDTDESARARYVWLQVRFHAGLAIIPVLATVAAIDIAEWWFPGVSTAPNAWVLFLAILVALVLVYPFMLRILWAMSPLPDGKLRDRLLQMAEDAGVDFREILVWKTDNRVVNAAVTGLLPNMRNFVFSDGLLDELSEDEVVAAFAHEVAHVRCRHLLLRLSAFVLPALGFVLTRYQANPTDLARYMPTSVMALTGIVTAGLYIWCLGWLNRLLEYHADRVACELLDQSFPAAFSPSTLADTSQSLYRRMLARISMGEDRDRSGWTHPSTSQRIAHISAISVGRRQPQM